MQTTNAEKTRRKLAQTIQEGEIMSIGEHGEEPCSAGARGGAEKSGNARVVEGEKWRNRSQFWLVVKKRNKSGAYTLRKKLSQLPEKQYLPGRKGSGRVTPIPFTLKGKCRKEKKNTRASSAW